MTPADAEAVSALLRHSWERTYTPLMGAEKVAAQNESKHGAQSLVADLARPHSESFVASTENGTVAGYAYAIVTKGVLWLDRLHVAPEHQGSGIADGLLQAVMVNYVGEPSISLEVIEGNNRAMRFYEKHGFDVVERKSACGSIDGVPAIVMRRPLSRA
ncbi:MAG: GNAT family N-acetyltransferase [Rhizobiaceae bacterium]|nr:GNAT family N-acetyltransferase [Rhizobiaceae bacterium]